MPSRNIWKHPRLEFSLVWCVLGPAEWVYSLASPPSRSQMDVFSEDAAEGLAVPATHKERFTFHWHRGLRLDPAVIYRGTMSNPTLPKWSTHTSAGTGHPANAGLWAILIPVFQRKHALSRTWTFVAFVAGEWMFCQHCASVRITAMKIWAGINRWDLALRDNGCYCCNALWNWYNNYDTKLVFPQLHKTNCNDFSSWSNPDRILCEFWLNWLTSLLREMTWLQKSIWLGELTHSTDSTKLTQLGEMTRPKTNKSTQLFNSKIRIRLKTIWLRETSQLHYPVNWLNLEK